MIRYNPLLCLDFYKTAHADQYPAGLTRIVSYYTPRDSRLHDVDKITMFGLQAFIKEYLIDAFNENFFDRPYGDVLDEYKRVLGATIGTYGVGENESLRFISWVISRFRSVPFRRDRALTSKFRKSRFPIHTRTSFGWSIQSRPCCHAPCGTPRFQQKLGIVTARSSMSLPSAPVMITCLAPSLLAIFLCAGRKASKAPQRVPRHSA